MSYTVLARRYRSGTFDELIGQEHVAQTLKRAIQTGRIAHAYLFCGTRGTGKTSTARILAKALNCEKFDAPTTEPCGQCATCKAIARGEDMDVIEIDAASNRGIDDVRRIIENAVLSPARSRYKVYIIDEVHGLTKDAFNALLKVLEEPPSHVKFILATTEPEKLLATILSRCQRFDFRNIPTRQIADHLVQVCRKENIPATEEALLLVAHAGAGSMRDALSLLDRLLSVVDGELSVQQIESLLGVPRSRLLLDLAQAIGSGDVAATLQQAEQIMSQGLSADSLIVALTEHLHNLLVLKTCGPKSNILETSQQTIEEFSKQAELFDLASLTQSIAILEELRRQLRTSQASRPLLDACLARLALAGQFVSVQSLLSNPEGSSAAFNSAPISDDEKKNELLTPPAPKDEAPEHPPIEAEEDELPAVGKVWQDSSVDLVAALKSKTDPSPAATTPAQPVVASASPVGPAAEPRNWQNNLPGLWACVLEKLAEQAPALPANFTGAQLVALDEHVAVIRYNCANATFASLVEHSEKKKRALIHELAALLGRNVGVRFETQAAEEADAASTAAPAIAAPTTVGPAQPEPARPSAAPQPPAVDHSAGKLPLTPQLREEILAHPLVKGVVDVLGGNLYEVKKESE